MVNQDFPPFIAAKPKQIDLEDKLREQGGAVVPQVAAESNGEGKPKRKRRTKAEIEASTTTAPATRSYKFDLEQALVLLDGAHPEDHQPILTAQKFMETMNAGQRKRVLAVINRLYS